jgi:hypothetical protein
VGGEIREQKPIASNKLTPCFKFQANKTAISYSNPPASFTNSGLTRHMTAAAAMLNNYPQRGRYRGHMLHKNK